MPPLGILSFNSTSGKFKNGHFEAAGVGELSEKLFSSWICPEHTNLSTLKKRRRKEVIFFYVPGRWWSSIIIMVSSYMGVHLQRFQLNSWPGVSF
jgi:hypothetical protein